MSSAKSSIPAYIPYKIQAECPEYIDKSAYYPFTLGDDLEYWDVYSRYDKQHTATHYTRRKPESSLPTEYTRPEWMFSLSWTTYTAHGEIVDELECLRKSYLSKVREL